MKRGICKYCGDEKELQKSHVIPKHFYTEYTREKFRVIDATDGTYKYVQNGSWDDEILCPTCDNKLKEYDDEGYKILLKDLANNKRSINDIPIAYLFDSNKFDYKKLRYFFISMLWRASISNKAEFNQVNLGKYENIALRIIKNKMEDENLFKIMVFREPDNKKFNKSVFVIKTKLANKVCYKFFFSQFVVCIIPSIKNIKWVSPIDERFFLNKNEFIIVEDDIFYEDKFKIFNRVKNRFRKLGMVK